MEIRELFSKMLHNTVFILNFTTMQDKRKKKWIGVGSGVLLIVLGILLNIVPNKLVGVFGLPLFLDCIGTVLAAMLGGVFPAVLVGFTTNLVKSLSGSFSMFYGVISIFIGLATVFFFNKKFFASIPKLFVVIFCYALLGGGLGSVFTYYLHRQSFGTGVSAPFAQYLHEILGTSVFYSQLMADVVVDLFDKSVTVVIAIVVFHFISRRVKNYLNHVFQRNVNDKNAGMAVRYSLLGKVMLVVIVSELLLAVFVANIGYFLYQEKAVAKYTSIAYGLTDAAAIVLDGNRLMTYLQEGREAEGYEETEKELYAIREGFPTAKYLYVYHIAQDGCHVVFDLMSTDGEEPSQVGDVVPFDPSFEEYLPALLKGDSIGPVVSDDSYGWLLTVYKPLKDSSGTTVAYVAADITMESILMDEISFLIKELSLFFGVSLVIMCLIAEAMKRGIVIPINRMSQEAISFAHNSDVGRQISLRRVKAIDIRSDDEIQNLYNAFSTMAEDFLAYIIQIKAQNERITKMQDEIVVSFAELVEARDEGTGNHIKKTAAYVEAIARQLKKEGFYADELTDESIARFKRSAPLHDIGKIAISDLILNKPGKLTDEEFEIMKTHTTEGWKILQKIVANTGDSMEAEYLREAIEMAHYHHEKWDGSGYPNHIKGDEIPLSARIMAVADVFDALVAERVYKKPFTFEKAMAIITEGAGKHFDPKVVEAFSHIAADLYDERTKLSAV